MAKQIENLDLKQQSSNKVMLRSYYGSDGYYGI